MDNLLCFNRYFNDENSEYKIVDLGPYRRANGLFRMIRQNAQLNDDRTINRE